MLKISIFGMSLKMTNLRLQLHLPGTNELNWTRALVHPHCVVVSRSSYPACHPFMYPVSRLGWPPRRAPCPSVRVYQRGRIRPTWKTSRGTPTICSPWVLGRDCQISHYSDVTWVSWHLKWLATQLFVHQLVQLTIKRTSKLHITGSYPLGGDWWIPCEGPVMWKAFPFIMQTLC